MQTIRTYSVRGGTVYCIVDFEPEDQDFDQDPDFASVLGKFSITMSALISPARRSTEKHYDSIVTRFNVKVHPLFPRKVVFAEAERFLSTLKTMYEL